ncbi:GNAT family N-acetyltransferase [Streptomyces sp. NPDC057909]|uniref:GNAT family N-acetyltransferase n=1 Tax=Streptomyces sp. NPDC057909 TaxID=3346277 RepID=UPI0036F17DE8
MKETVTYLHMTDPAHLQAGQPVDGLSLQPATTLDGTRALHEAIGGPHHWARCTWSDDQWERWLHDPRHTQWHITLDGDTIGALELESNSDGGVEIVVFGLLPAHTGKGLGAGALTLATRTAWAATDTHGRSPRQVWLLTSTLDHPRALPNYLNRGFRVFRTVTRDHPSTPPASAEDRKIVPS